MKKRKNLGCISVKGKKVRVWLEGGNLHFRSHRKRRVEVISLQHCWDRATKQLLLWD